MKVFEMEEFSDGEIESFFRKRVKRKGILTKQELESVTVSQPTWRPFRFVRFDASRIRTNQKETFRSLLDETLAPLAIVSDDWFLLWRPTHTEKRIQSIDKSINSTAASDSDDDNLRNFIDAFVNKIQESRKTLLGMDEELRGIQLGSGAAFPFLIPRSPKSRHRENDLALKRKSIHSFSVAASLVTNCPLEYRIDSFEIEGRVHIQAIMAIFQDIESGKERFLFLENIGDGSLDKALQNGIALSRICEKDDLYQKKLRYHFS
jgi:hypothetical protein